MIDQIVTQAAAATEEWARTTPTERAAVLDAIADGLDARADDLVALAMTETHLAEARLRGELKRTTFQLRIFGEVVREGSWLDARIDHADPDWPMGAPRPDLRRQLEPLGPVVVFAASNFPFAFSVAGGDTAAALAAGCAVVLKGHSGHPELSTLTTEVVRAAADAAGAPANLLQLVLGTENGTLVLQHPLIKAGSFTGSIRVGRLLYDIAGARPEPIPFYGELGSTNPVIVTRAADEARSAEIVSGFAASMSGSAGQLCTKPGVLLVPEGAAVLAELAATELPAPMEMLNDNILRAFLSGAEVLATHADVSALIPASTTVDGCATPQIWQTTAATVLAEPDALLAEVFGPSALVVTYASEDELLAVVAAFEGQLTATLFAEESDALAATLVPILTKKAGRLLWNQWPTGVSVTYAQQHGGPYPATTAVATTAVGTGAITRFLRPVAYQNLPEALLPPALRESNPWGIPRRVDGVRG